MKRSFFNPFPTALRWQIGIISLVCGAIVLQNVPVLAQISRSQAQTVTVRIDRPNGENGGSGALVKREGNRYTVLTNCHVLHTKKPLDPRFYPISGIYQLEINGDRYPVSITSPLCHPRGIDLAIIQFQSDKDYPYPTIRSETNLEILLNEPSITGAGFNNVYQEPTSGALQRRRFQFGQGSWRDQRDNINDGYDLLHDYATLPGMSGGPIFDAQGNLVAINGETVPVNEGVTYFAAIPIHYYTSWQLPATTLPVRPTPTPTPTVRPTPTPTVRPTPTPNPQRTFLGLPVEPYSYTSARVSASGAVTPYNANSPLGKYTETALRLPANAVSLDMVAIPGGTFTMGSPESEALRDSDESPQHRVTIPDFFMGRYEVTQAQWFAVMGSDYNANGWQERWRSLDSNFKGDNLPIVRVSWDDAQEFIQRLNRLTGKTYRLPTEAEWEYAARAGTTTPFSYGETITPEVVNYDGNFPYGRAPKGEYRERTIEVNSLYPNPWGLYHIHGNVWEWVQDQYHDSYANKPSTLVSDGSNPWITNTNALASNDLRVLRGGSWFNVAWSSRSANRYRGNRDLRYDFNGFRVVLVP